MARIGKFLTRIMVSTICLWVKGDATRDPEDHIRATPIPEVEIKDPGGSACLDVESLAVRPISVLRFWISEDLTQA